MKSRLSISPRYRRGERVQREVAAESGWSWADALEIGIVFRGFSSRGAVNLVGKQAALGLILVDQDLTAALAGDADVVSFLPDFGTEPKRRADLVDDGDGVANLGGVTLSTTPVKLYLVWIGRRSARGKYG